MFSDRNHALFIVILVDKQYRKFIYSINFINKTLENCNFLETDNFTIFWISRNFATVTVAKFDEN